MIKEHSELILAIFAASPARVAGAIESGADVNDDSQLEIPLCLAAKYGSLEICRLLLGAGADPSKRKNANGQTSLMAASEYGWVDVCQLLVDADADPYAKSLRGSALVLAGRRNPGATVEILQILLSVSGPEVGEVSDQTMQSMVDALCFYAARGNATICKMLLNAGADVNATDSLGATPLLEAATNNRVQICAILIQAGADLAITGACSGKPGLTPFQGAVRSGAVDVVTYFLREQGEDPGQRTASNCTMLRLAADHPEVKALLRSDRTMSSVIDALGSQISASVGRKRLSSEAL